jgi:UDP-N-acetylglucosamine--N-acetylmuramyl-(pentapeptide) pyrophosphoryl-undecaprenol N-acetylglucosamine transferase
MFHPGREKAFIIAGGGTGGHLFPGIAVAGELAKRYRNASILFVVGRRKMESEILSDYGYEMTSINLEGLKGRGWKKGLAVLCKIPGSLLRSARILRGFSPDMVLGMGGYSSGPLCLTASFMGIATAIHEQNSYPGLTNRLLARFVDCVFLSFADAGKHLKPRSWFLSGNPVRQELLALSGDTGAANRSGFTLLAVGGSQGARAINKAFAEALRILKDQGRLIHVIHQTGQTDYERAVKDYQEKGIKGQLAPFIKDMGRAYHRADLIIGRAGASTVFELAALAKPSILIPYPYAANQHQKHNAQSLVKIGGAEMICQSDLSGQKLAQVIIKYIDSPSDLEEMGRQAQKLARHNAAGLIVDKLEQIINQ